MWWDDSFWTQILQTLGNLITLQLKGEGTERATASIRQEDSSTTSDSLPKNKDSGNAAIIGKCLQEN